MGKPQQPLLELAQLQENNLLQLETGHAQATYWIDALNTLVGAQLNAARCSLEFATTVKTDQTAPFSIPQADYKAIAKAQAEFTRAVTATTTQFAKQSAALAQSYWDEQQRRLKATFAR